MKIGKLPENVLKRSVLRQINMDDKKRKGAGVGVDCAIFMPEEDTPVAVCMQEAPVITEPEEEREAITLVDVAVTIGTLIQRCANNLAAEGALTKGILITLMLPEEITEAEIRKLMQEADEKCRELGLQICGGQTSVTDAVRYPIAIVTGMGTFSEEMADSGDCSDMDVVVTKWIGLEGTAILARRNRDKLLSRYPEYLVDEAAGFLRYLSVIPEAATAMKSGACMMHDASEGGIFAGLWEIAERAGVGLKIDMRKLPLRQETVEVCEYCDANPYELRSGGCLIVFASDGQGLADELQEKGIPAVVVGKTTDNHDRILINGDEIRYLDRPKQDAVYCQIMKSGKEIEE